MQTLQGTSITINDIITSIQNKSPQQTITFSEE